MQKLQPRVWLGLGLIVIGVLVLLDQMRWLYFREEWIVATAFLVGGIWCLSLYQRDKMTWKLICGLIGISIGMTIILDSLSIVAGDYLGGLIVLLLAGIFILLYSRNPKMWWALIPGGILLTVGARVLLEEAVWSFRYYADSFVLIGIGLTFGYLYKIRTAENRLDWAKWLAIICLVIGGVKLLNEIFYDLHIEEFALPVALILIGAYLILRNLRRRGENGPAEVTTT